MAAAHSGPVVSASDNTANIPLHSSSSPSIYDSMPGRDPAVHTHLPSPSTSPHADHRTLGRRASSSAFARVPSDHHAPAAPSAQAAPPSSSRRVSVSDGVSRLLRRMSVSAADPADRHDVEHQAAGGEPGASDSEDEHDE